MDQIEIEGGNRLNGKVALSGSKNASLPIMAATLLTHKKVNLSNVPELADVCSMISLLKSLNSKISFKDNNLSISSDTPNSFKVSYDLVRKMRASFLILGPLLTRYGSAEVSMPGGCAIGTRPIDLHIEGLKKMGAKFKIKDGYVKGVVEGRLKGASINLKNISVGATENIMMAATLAHGTTIIKNAAREPEVVDLARFLIKMGSDIKGFGTKKIIINGKKNLKGCDFSVMPDRIEAGTFILALYGCSGKIILEKITNEISEHLIKIFSQLKDLNLEKKNNGGKLVVEKTHQKSITLRVNTREYPGFPTDLQAQLTAALMKTSGMSEIRENIFENRFMHVSELKRMGANLDLEGSKLQIIGVKEIYGAEVMATDLRASSSLIIAGLMAQGKTLINRVYHLDRGYESIEHKLSNCGAKIRRLKK